MARSAQGDVTRAVVLRTTAGRTHQALVTAIWAALDAITPADAAGCFRSGGYLCLAQS